MGRFSRILILASLLGMVLTSAHGRDGPTVFAAASLREVLEDIAGGFQQAGGTKVRLVFAASSVLARQIDSGAPADIYVSADEDWIEWLADRDAINEKDRRVVARNSLVVGFAEGVQPPQKLDAMLTIDRFAMGDPNHVPAGRYAVSALKKFQIWKIVRSNAVFGENVRVALEFLRRGEVSAAIVYASDLTAVPELVKAYVFPDDSHKPIRYVAVQVANGERGAVEFLEFMSGERGKALFAKYGFRPP